jgi:hypothetical protein
VCAASSTADTVTIAAHHHALGAPSLRHTRATAPCAPSRCTSTKREAAVLLILRCEAWRRLCSVGGSCLLRPLSGVLRILLAYGSPACLKPFRATRLHPFSLGCHAGSASRQSLMPGGRRQQFACALPGRQPVRPRPFMCRLGADVLWRRPLLYFLAPRQCLSVGSGGAGCKPPGLANPLSLLSDSTTRPRISSGIQVPPIMRLRGFRHGWAEHRNLRMPLPRHPLPRRNALPSPRWTETFPPLPLFQDAGPPAWRKTCCRSSPRDGCFRLRSPSARGTCSHVHATPTSTPAGSPPSAPSLETLLHSSGAPCTVATLSRAAM